MIPGYLVFIGLGIAILFVVSQINTSKKGNLIGLVGLIISIGLIVYGASLYINA